MSPENLQAPANQVIAQLSDANGSFSNPIELGRITTNSSGSMTVSIPSGIEEGTGYRIRLVTTNSPMISEDNGANLTITSVSDLAEKMSPWVRIHPNPAHRNLYISSDQELSRVELVNLTGGTVLVCQPGDKDSELSLNGIASGIYLVHCQCSQQHVYRKLVIQ